MMCVITDPFLKGVGIKTRLTPLLASLAAGNMTGNDLMISPILCISVLRKNVLSL